MPSFGASATPLSVLLPALRTNFSAAAARYGRQTGIDSPWTFIVQSDATVTAIDRHSRSGLITVAVPTPEGVQSVQLQAGPVLSGSAVRDSQPYISFNDFTNQIAYAKVSSQMNQRALVATAPQLARLRVGDHIHFAGAFTESDESDAVRIMPTLVRVGS